MTCNGSATNLRRHLFVKHDIVGAVYNSQLAQIKQQSAQPSDSSTTLSKDRKKQMDQAIIGYIIDDSLPFTTFMRPRMINLIRIIDPRYEPSSRFSIASRVKDAYNKYVDQVKVS